jgi:hypothetical protein
MSIKLVYDLTLPGEEKIFFRRHCGEISFVFVSCQPHNQTTTRVYLISHLCFGRNNSRTLPLVYRQLENAVGQANIPLYLE